MIQLLKSKLRKILTRRPQNPTNRSIGDMILSEMRGDQLGAKADFIREFISNFCRDHVSDSAQDELIWTDRYPDSVLAIISDYCSCLKKNNMVPLVKNINSQLSVEFDRLNSASSLSFGSLDSSRLLKDTLKKIDFLTEVWLKCDVWLKDFADDSLACEVAPKILNILVHSDLGPAHYKLAQKLLRVIAEVPNIEVTKSSFNDVYNKYAIDFKSHLSLVTLSSTVPRRPYRIGLEKEFDKFRSDLASRFRSRLELAGLYDQAPDCPKIAKSLSVSEAVAVANFFAHQLEKSFSNEIVDALRSGGRLDSYWQIGKHLNLVIRNDRHMLMQMFQEVVSDRANKHVVPAVFAELSEIGMAQEAIQVFNLHRNLLRDKVAAHLKNYCATAKYNDFFEVIVEYLEVFGSKKHDATNLFQALSSVYEHWYEMQFISQINEFNARVAQGSGHSGTIVTLVNSPRALRLLPLPMLLDAKRKGWRIIHLNNQFISERSQGEAIEGILNRLSFERDPKPLNWKIDFEGECAELEGINYWRGLYEHLSIGLRRYHMDYKSLKVRREFYYRKKNIELAILATQAVLREYPAGYPIRFFIGDVHTTPGHSIRLFIETNRFSNVEVVNYKNGYENLHKSSPSRVSSRISVENVTRNGLNYARLGTPTDFAEWRTNLTNKQELCASSRRRLIGAAGSVELSDAQKEFLEEIEQDRSYGKKIICLVGKVIYDLIEPVQAGIVHNNLKHWINHTCEIVAASTNLKLIIKPHPHEKLNNIALFGAEIMADLVEVVSPRVHVLAADFIPFAKLLPVIDLGVLWSGTACLELAAMNVPIVAASRFSRVEFPIGTTEPSSLADYESIIRFERPDFKFPDLSENALLFYEYLASNRVSVPFGYTNRPASNRNVWPNECIVEDFNRFFASGDIHAIRNLEKFS